MKDFKVCAVQCAPSITGPREANLALLEHRLREAVENGADFTAFPEVCLSGYVDNTEERRARAMPLDSALVDRAVALSATYHTWFSFGLFEQNGDRCHNTYVLAGHGKRHGIYRKVHVPARERNLFTPGNEFPVFDLPFARIGFATCYDNKFCETHQCLALNGAEVIVMPYAWAEHWEREDYVEPCSTDEEVLRERQRFMYMLFGARCRDTGTYSVMVDHSGMEAHGPWRFVGKSMIFAPTGKVLAEAAGWKDEMLFADLDADLLRRYRDMDCFVLKSRRPDAYGPSARAPAGPDRGIGRCRRKHGNAISVASLHARQPGQ